MAFCVTKPADPVATPTLEQRMEAIERKLDHVLANQFQQIGAHQSDLSAFRSTYNPAMPGWHGNR